MMDEAPRIEERERSTAQARDGLRTRERVRVGCVPYLVARPLVEGLTDLDEEEFELTAKVPSRLIEDLRAARIDVALASSIEFFRSPGTTILPQVGIVAREEVMSVQLFSRVPWEQIRSVALDPASRSGRALIRILLSRRAGPACEFLPLAHGEEPSGAPTDAFLVIGDPALRASLDRSRLPAGVEYNFDLATEWRRETGTPFTFAVWIARPGARLGDLPRLLIEARDRGLPRRAEIAARAARETGLPRAALEHYLIDVCSYDLDLAGVKEGLRLFGHHAAELGLVERERDLEFYPI